MNQQSGHLNDAQVAQYGNTVRPGQPEADDRDHEIEAHLAGCDICRERVLSAQRVRFTLLAVPEMSSGPNARRPGSANPDGTAPGPNCPDEDDLRSLAAGLFPSDQASKLAQHAAQCDHCGPLLRSYIADFSDDASDENPAFLSKLKSSSADWQKKLVADVRAASGKSTAKSEKKPFPWRWVWAPAALAACVAIAFGVWYQQRETPEKVEKLLAEAYTEQRTMEMRIPGAAYSALSPQQRGNSGNQSPNLFQAKAIILSHLRERANSGSWLHALGREEILEGRSEEAIADLKRALELAPSSVPIMVDLATAYFQRAEPAQNTDDYSEAVELLGKALATRPDDPVILFNRALLYQRMSPPLYESSLKDWTHYLTIEPKGPWSGEARRHKEEIETLKKNFPATK